MCRGLAACTDSLLTSALCARQAVYEQPQLLLRRGSPLADRNRRTLDGSRESIRTHVTAPSSPAAMSASSNRSWIKNYISFYCLLQFCGHSWIFTNMIARLLFFGEDSFADTFYTVGLVMQACQLLSILELLHVLLGIEQRPFLPKLLQLTERLVILFVVITSQEEVQSKCIVCFLFFLWNLWDVLRYSYQLLSAVEVDYPELTWISHTLWIPIYPLTLLAEVYTVYESLPHFESLGTFSYKIVLPFSLSIYFPYILKAYLAFLPAGMLCTCSHFLSERKSNLKAHNGKMKMK
ncbi:very-long-chain (3R)-3-hydroxyacyl-CoA dehydratase 4 [Hyperolius riggenbachi]|uniref:very-long-chain (3R)-3-hydroxyacyl-CoA dehydratase 4 n=1 Tax=Hyperolius riggenbachi TaxID=752182 RepID=UPI0035A28EE2